MYLSERRLWIPPCPSSPNLANEERGFRYIHHALWLIKKAESLLCLAVRYSAFCWLVAAVTLLCSYWLLAYPLLLVGLVSFVLIHVALSRFFELRKKSFALYSQIEHVRNQLRKITEYDAVPTDNLQQATNALSDTLASYPLRFLV